MLMQLSRRILHQQRRQLDERLVHWQPVRHVPRPRSGWLRAVREALGMTTRQLAVFLGTNNAAILRMQTRELMGRVTLRSLDRAAQAMGCKLVYALVPDETLERIVDDKARVAARELSRSVAHTMTLENQKVAQGTAQLAVLAGELKARLDPTLWTKRK